MWEIVSFFYLGNSVMFLHSFWCKKAQVNVQKITIENNQFSKRKLCISPCILDKKMVFQGIVLNLTRHYIMEIHRPVLYCNNYGCYNSPCPNQNLQMSNIKTSGSLTILQFFLEDFLFELAG